MPDPMLTASPTPKQIDLHPARTPQRISYEIVPAIRAWSSAVTPSPSSTTSSPTRTPSIPVTSTIVRFIETRPTIPARPPRTIAHPPGFAFVEESSRRSPSAYPTGSSASRIGPGAVNVALYPTVSPAATSRTSNTRVFHVITGRSAARTLDPAPAPAPSIARQYPYSEIPHRTIARAPTLFASPTSHSEPPPRAGLSTDEELPACTHFGRSPFARTCATAASNRRSCSRVFSEPATSAAQKCVITPSRTSSAAPIRSNTASNSAPGRTPCRPMPVSTSRCTEDPGHPHKQHSCASVQTTGVSRLSTVDSQSARPPNPSITRISASANPAASSARLTRAPSLASATPNHRAPTRASATAHRSAPCPYAFAFTTASTSVSAPAASATARKSPASRSSDTSIQLFTATAVSSPRPHTLAISTASSTCLGYPCLATASIARPTCSVVVTYFGHTRSNNGSAGFSTVYVTRYSVVFDRIPWSGTIAPGRNMYALLNPTPSSAFSVSPFTRAHIVRLAASVPAPDT